MGDSSDFHIDPSLERLFHDNSPGFQEGGGEENMTEENFPAWLIGVVVVIVILVIAFFVMVISTLIKNKRKHRSADCSDNNSTTHICDDLELGKISQIDPRYPITNFIPADRQASNGIEKKVQEYPPDREQPITEAACSSVNNDGSLSLVECKNPLFVDDDLEAETAQGTSAKSNGKTEEPCRTKGQFTKRKSLKTGVFENLKSVDEDSDECNVTNNNEGSTGPVNDRKEDSKVKNSNSSYPCNDNESKATKDQRDDHVLIHCPAEVIHSDTKPQVLTSSLSKESVELDSGRLSEDTNFDANQKDADVQALGGSISTSSGTAGSKEDSSQDIRDQLACNGPQLTSGSMESTKNNVSVEQAPPGDTSEGSGTCAVETASVSDTDREHEDTGQPGTGRDEQDNDSSEVATFGTEPDNIPNPDLDIDERDFTKL